MKGIVQPDSVSSSTARTDFSDIFRAFDVSPAIFNSLSSIIFSPDDKKKALRRGPKKARLTELSFDSFYRAAVFTCAAVNASVGYFVAAVFLDDSFYRACSSASAAFYANILINLVHFFLLVPC